MFGIFSRKKDLKDIRENMQKSFHSVREDFRKVGEWITHLDGKNKINEDEIASVKMRLDEIESSLEEIKNFVSFFGPHLSKRLSKQTQTGVIKQTPMEHVQTAVQTAVQTGILANLTVMERALVWALLNSDMKLSYDDLATILGKDKSTIRGQINTIKQKSEGLIEEITEIGGKKRVFIPESVKNLVVKNVKVRVKSVKNSKKGEKTVKDE